jgi:hypothetical protein
MRIGDDIEDGTVLIREKFGGSDLIRKTGGRKKNSILFSYQA